MSRHFLGFDTPPLDQPEPELVEVSTPDETREALTHLAHTAMRMPAHWTDRRAVIHERMNELLDLLDASDPA